MINIKEYIAYGVALIGFAYGVSMYISIAEEIITRNNIELDYKVMIETLKSQYDSLNNSQDSLTSEINRMYIERDSLQYALEHLELKKEIIIKNNEKVVDSIADATFFSDLERMSRILSGL